MGDRERYIHLKEVFVDFIKRRPTSVLEIVFKDEAGAKYKSSKFKGGDLVHWNLDTYVRSHTYATLTIQLALFKTSVAQIEIEFKPNEFGDHRAVELEDRDHCVTVNFNCGRSKSLADVTRIFGSQAHTNLASSKFLRFLKPPQLALAALPPPTSKRGCPAVHWLNDDILLDIFHCYRLNANNRRIFQLVWCKLSHVCQRWRHLMREYAFHLDVHIECTNTTSVVDTLDRLPPLPLVVDYKTVHKISGVTILTEQDELGIYHALRLHDRVRHIDLNLPPLILHKVLVLMDQHFLILEHLSLSFTTSNDITPTLPESFLAPNLRHLALPSVSSPKQLRFLISTVSLVTLKLSDIKTPSYFCPKLLVARLRSLPHLKELSIEFSIPVPRPSAERELLDEQRTPVTLPSLTDLRFKGVGAYLEFLIAQIEVPLLERLWITLLNQIAFALPHLSHLINITEAFKFPRAVVGFNLNEVYVTTMLHGSGRSGWVERGPFFLGVICEGLGERIDCAAQICHALIPALSGVERFALHCDHLYVPTELRSGAIDSTTWHKLLRSFIGLKELRMDYQFLEGLSRALQVDEVGSDPRFLPNLWRIVAPDNLFASFIYTRRVVGRPVQFLQLFEL